MRVKLLFSLALAFLAFTHSRNSFAAADDQIQIESLDQIYFANQGLTSQQVLKSNPQNPGMQVTIKFPTATTIGQLGVEIVNLAHANTVFSQTLRSKTFDPIYLGPTRAIRYHGYADGVEIMIDVDSYGRMTIDLWTGYKARHEAWDTKDYRHTHFEKSVQLAGATVQPPTPPITDLDELERKDYIRRRNPTSCSILFSNLK